MRYGPDWIPPWRETKQAVCQSSDCTLKEPRLVIASTLIAGHCVQCAKRLGLTENDEAPRPPEQLELGLGA
jgi:hypothetical protein